MQAPSSQVSPGETGRVSDLYIPHSPANFPNLCSSLFIASFGMNGGKPDRMIRVEDAVSGDEQHAAPDQLVDTRLVFEQRNHSFVHPDPTASDTSSTVTAVPGGTILTPCRRDGSGVLEDATSSETPPRQTSDPSKTVSLETR